MSFSIKEIMTTHNKLFEEKGISKEIQLKNLVLQKTKYIMESFGMPLQQYIFDYQRIYDTQLAYYARELNIEVTPIKRGD